MLIEGPSNIITKKNYSIIPECGLFGGKQEDKLVNDSRKIQVSELKLIKEMRNYKIELIQW